jgi:hypothetical protein
LAFAISLLTAGTARARDFALVIGNNAYENVPKLRTATADAASIGDRLERLGFIVRRAIDVDQRAMSRALSDFEADLGPGDRAFFFFAGHGMEIGGANYLLPTDVPAAVGTQSTLVRDAAVPVSRIIDDVGARGPAVTILVLDACRDNPFAKPGSRSAAISGGLARVDAPQGVFVLMSAGAKQEALDRLSDADPNQDSVFTRTFLHELERPERTLVQIAKATQLGVRDLAATVGYEQTPAYYDQVIGDVVLAGSTPGTSPAPAVLSNAGPSPASAPVPAMPAVTATSPQTASAPAKPEPATPSPIVPAAPTRQQMAALPSPLLQPPPSGDPRLPQLSGRAPIANFMRSNQGWTATFSLPEPALAISYRIGQTGEFRSTGLTDTLSAATGERSPNPSFPMPARAQAGIIEIRYQTPNGVWVGPFAIRFDPDAELFRQDKKILEQLEPSWVEFAANNGPFVYFTTLVSYRCAISELLYGFDAAKPLSRFDMPSCNPADPFAIPPGAATFLRISPSIKTIHLQITWRDGTQSEINTIER